ncbi:MAG: hypothetical protein JRD89_01635 [Deltaproteobacteria bacterium]|nr:hypothetical protein [Deltaproteobacteria bacterium]
MKTYAIDTETDLIRLGCKAPPLVCVQITEDTAPDEGVIFLHSEPGLKGFIKSLLLSALKGQARLIFHNAAFDLAVFAAKWPDLMPLIFAALAKDGAITDTMIRQKLLDIAAGEFRGKYGHDGTFIKYGYGLGHLSERHLGMVLDKTSKWRTGYFELAETPVTEWPAEAREYAENDPVATYGVWAHQENNLADYPSGVLDDEPRQVRKAWALFLAEAWGMKTDPEAVDALEAEAVAEIVRLQAYLHGLGLLTLKKDGSYSRKLKLARERMIAACEASGVEVPTTDKGNVKLDAEAMALSGDVGLIALQEYGVAQNILSKDVTALRSPIIHPRFDSLVGTGRTSASGYNTQNPRKKVGVRECFVPRKGKVYLNCDYDKAELHTLAETCLGLVGYSRLAEALNAGRDPHLDYGALIESIDLEWARENPKHPTVKQARQRAKAGNFGIPGGMGAKGFQAYAKGYGLELDMTEARHIFDSYFEAWPEVREFHTWIKAQCTGYGGEGLFQMPYSGRYRGGVRFTQAANLFFQGPAADGAGLALFAVAYAQYCDTESPLFGSRTVNFIHDELMLEVDEGKAAAAAAAELERVMVEEFTRVVPNVPPRATACLSRRWSKGAEPVFNAEGTLIPWEPEL